MSLTNIKTVIENFITNDKNDALVIKGKYGVGKTFHWRKWIDEASEVTKPYYEGITKGGGRDRKIGKPNYAYVSLFGIENLDSLKNAIFNEMAGSKNIGSFTNRSDKLSKKFFAKLEKIPELQKFTGGFLSSLAFQDVRNALICFDDIDRKSENLSITEILGLANLLREQHNCKIILILNENELKDEGEEFRKQIEKLIDYQIVFAPETNEILDYVFSDSFPYSDFIKDCCRKLQIKNVRTFQKIHRYIEELNPHLKSLETQTIEEILQSLILFVWCHYNKEKDVPSIEFVKDFSSVRFYLKEQNKEQISDEETEWTEILQKYNYRMMEELEHIILSFVENGYLNEKNFSEKVGILNQGIIQQKGQNQYSQAWKLYRSSFEDNEAEFIEQLILGFRANMKHLSIRHLDEAVSVLRELEATESANILVNEFVDNHIDNDDLIKIKGHSIDFKAKDSYLIRKLDEKLYKFEEKRTLKEVLERVASKDSYGLADIEFLASVSVNDFYDYFKSTKPFDTYLQGSGYIPDLYYQIKSCLKYEGSRDEPFKTVGLNTKRAVIKIALESRINKLRVMNWFEITEHEIEQARKELNSCSTSKAG
jgi:hypothetical protein